MAHRMAMTRGMRPRASQRCSAHRTDSVPLRVTRPARQLGNASPCPGFRSVAPRLLSIRVMAVAGVAPSPSTPPSSGSGGVQDSIPKLMEMEVHPFINAQGMVLPPAYTTSSGTPPAAYVFAVFDAHQKLQYVGFSQELRNTLRTLLGRRPDKAFFFKAHPVAALNQAHMLAVRDAWFQEVGGAPSGNKLALERAMWQAPVDAFAVSSRGKQAAAEDQARQILEDLALRGLREVFVPNPVLLETGQVDFLPSADLSPEALAALAEAQAAVAAAQRVVHTVIDGEERTFHVRFTHKHATPKGAFVVDVRVTLDNRETAHRVIVGRQYVDGLGLTGPEPAIEAAMAVILSTKQVRHTTGVMPVGQFPVNYFTVSEVEQWFGPEFRDAFKIATGKALEWRASLAWRFTRLHSYNSGLLLDATWGDDQLGGHESELGQRTSNFVFE